MDILSMVLNGVSLIVGTLLGGYLTGKVYARQLQELQHKNDLLLEQLRARQQLRMAALEKRLQVHQEAYTLWRKLRSNVSSPNLYSVVSECQQWWESNCLYLAPDARATFARAHLAAAFHGELLAQGKNAPLALSLAL